jgi:hypothetical protein
MSELIQLNDDEIAAVAGGVAVVIASQSNSSRVNQDATALNFGRVSASVGGARVSIANTAAAAGAEAQNVAEVGQSNSIRAVNV